MWYFVSAERIRGIAICLPGLWITLTLYFMILVQFSLKILCGLWVFFSDLNTLERAGTMPLCTSNQQVALGRSIPSSLIWVWFDLSYVVQWVSKWMLYAENWESYCRSCKVKGQGKNHKTWKALEWGKTGMWAQCKKPPGMRIVEYVRKRERERILSMQAKWADLRLRVNFYVFRKGCPFNALVRMCAQFVSKK